MTEKNNLKLKLDVYEDILSRKRILPNIFTLNGIWLWNGFRTDELHQLYSIKKVIKDIAPVIDGYVGLAIDEVKQYDENTIVEFISETNQLRSKIIKIRDSIKSDDEQAIEENKKYFNLYIDSLESVLEVIANL